MPAYLARLKDDKQIVGIYFVDSAEELFWLVDECCDPGAVELTPLGIGGVFWPTSIDTKVPVPEDDEQYNGLPAGASVSELWGRQFFGDEGESAWSDVPGPSEGLDD